MEQIAEKLDNINMTLKGILDVLSTPENKVMTVLKYVGAVVGVLGILTVIEIVRQWVIGG